MRSRFQLTRRSEVSLTVCRHRSSPTQVVESLQQSESARERKTAIVIFGKNLRRGTRFQVSWDAAGGASGIASLLAEFSVKDVRHMCIMLGRTASAVNARSERRTGLGKLVAILFNGSTDSRPLQKFYQAIIPACHNEVVQSWKATVEWTSAQLRCLQLAHREQYEQQFLKNIFSKHPDDKDRYFTQYVKLFRGNLSLCETVLVELGSLPTQNARIPDDFVYGFTMPLLKRLAKKKDLLPDKLDKLDKLDRFMGLVVHCFEKHPRQLKPLLRLDEHGGLIQYAMQRWVDYQETRELVEVHLQSLLTLIPSFGMRLHQIHDAAGLPRRLTPSKRHGLIRLLLMHVEAYHLDIEDENLASLPRLKELAKDGDLWPAAMFLDLKPKTSLALFTELERLHIGRSFVSCPGNGVTVLNQTYSHVTRTGDVDVVKALLLQRVDPEGSAWLDRVRLAVNERKKKASEAKEPRHRSFWARSALNLCTAAGDLEMLRDSFIWARRFNKDPLVGSEVHGKSTLGCRELEDLLIALPIREDLGAHERSADAMSTAKRDIKPANQVLLALTQTGLSVTAEPGFNANKWATLVELPGLVSEKRLQRSKIIRLLAAESSSPIPDSDIAEEIWNPTIDALLEIEALMSDPSAPKLKNHLRPRVFAMSFVLDLPFMRPSLLAEITSFYIGAVERRLAPTVVKSRIGHIIQTVLKVAESDQPALAIPFIRPIIQNSNDSSSHRQLLTNSFLQSLPAEAARQFLKQVAGAMIELMKEQNARPPPESEAKEQPAMKVTTVKMMAQLLEGNPSIDADTSCEILFSLLKEARHIDARITIITSLLSILEEPTTTPGLRMRILDVFKDYVVPMASQLNERHPTTEEDWRASEMPEVSEDHSILRLLITRARSKKLETNARISLVGLIMSALEQSALQNKRWVHLFIKKNSFFVRPEDKMPIGPANISLLVESFKQDFKHMPDPLFNMLQELALGNLNPNPSILQVTTTIKSDAEFLKSNAGRHWVLQFDHPGSEAYNMGLNQAAFLLREEGSLSRDHAKIKELQNFITAAVESWMRRGEVDVVYRLVRMMNARPFSEDGEAVDWRQRCIPVVKGFIRQTAQIRDEGHKVVLPSAFRLRLAMLRVPRWHRDQSLSEGELKSFVTDISELVDQLADQQRPYHNDFALLKVTAIDRPNFCSDYARVALMLARLSDVWANEDPLLPDYLRLELVAELLEVSPIPDEEMVKEDVRQLIQNWRRCASEDLRAIGHRVEAALKLQQKWNLN